MSNRECVTFGRAYFFDPDTREIGKIDSDGNVINQWDFTSYMTKSNGRWGFSDGSLALDILEEELKSDVIEAIDKQIELGARFEWIAVQLSLPLIELVGRLAGASGSNGDVFRYGAEKIFPRTIFAQPVSQDEYRKSIGSLWSGLRNGLLHSGYIKRKGAIDVNIVPGASRPPLSFSIDGEDETLAIGAVKFVERVKSAAQDEIIALRADPNRLDGDFIKAWRERWGSYATP
jgi:hypothetical protein